MTKSSEGWRVPFGPSLEVATNVGAADQLASSLLRSKAKEASFVVDLHDPVSRDLIGQALERLGCTVQSVGGSSIQVHPTRGEVAPIRLNAAYGLPKQHFN